MRTGWTWPILLLLAFVFSPLVEAQASRRIRLNGSATVYEQPSFSAPKIDQLAPQAIVVLGATKIVGNGGLGVFFKIKTPSGKTGYIADSDAVGKPVTTPDTPPAAPPPPPQAPPARPTPKPPIAANPSHFAGWGFSLGSVGYSEDLFGKSYKHQTWVLGTRYLSSGWPLGLLIDTGLLVSPQAPRFLSEAGASGKTSGFLILADVMMLWPLHKTSDFMIYVGPGLAPIYTSYKTNFDFGPYNSSNFRLGGEIETGLVLNIGAWSVRLDFKYYIERKSYLGQIITVQ